MNGTLIADDVARARALGIALTVNAREDRYDAGIDPTGLPGYSAPFIRGCPTCPDGMLTITHPRQCRECSRG